MEPGAGSEEEDREYAIAMGIEDEPSQPTVRGGKAWRELLCHGIAQARRPLRHTKTAAPGGGGGARASCLCSARGRHTVYTQRREAPGG